ncbi:MAG: three-Cys-motif partner protein TcmP [Bacteroidia bacterium]|nr:three-Cys-motif partner protein TcmP [Bacteroidia bacterium]
MKQDLHSKPFDETTKAKLAIFNDYLIEWLPVFTKRKDIIWKIINIYDFFAGPGFDSEGNKGTPILILNELKNHFDAIEQNRLEVNLYFNEFDESKNTDLKKNVLDNDGFLPYNVRIEKLDFKLAFDKEFSKMAQQGQANLIFLDQYGIKHITTDIFKKIINLKQTDFLFFISSSTIKRLSLIRL